MRTIISVLVLLYAFTSLSQRVSFEDPGLAFSFFKPKDWVMVDDGYYIKISPVMRDTANTYLTITYFEPPVPESNAAGTHFTVIEVDSPAKNEFASYMHSEDGVSILGFDVRPKRSLTEKQDIPLERRFYDFYRQNKNWEIITSAHADEFNKYNRTFKKILKSIRIETGETD